MESKVSTRESCWWRVHPVTTRLSATLVHTGACPHPLYCPRAYTLLPYGLANTSKRVPWDWNQALNSKARLLPLHPGPLPLPGFSNNSLPRVSSSRSASVPSVVKRLY